MFKADEKLVSIVMPAYNSEATIVDSIKSVQAQTYSNWELIVVNDCSTDRTKEIVIELIKDDDRIILINQEVNSKVAAARNKGVANSKGDYIAYLDSDDKWSENKLKSQLDFMVRNSYKFTFTNTIVINEEGKVLGNRIAPEIMDFNALLKSNQIACLTVMLDAEIAKNYPMEDIGHEDYLNWLEITKSGILAYNTNELLGYYRVASNSLSGNKFRAAKWQWNIYKNKLQLGYIKSTINFMYYIYYGLKKVR